MRPRRVPPMILLVAAIGAVLACACTVSTERQVTDRRPETAEAARVSSVLLLANMAEADASCGCGDVIRAVRSAAAKGVRTREIDARNSDESGAVVQQYRVTVQPVVLLLDEGEREVRRFEGESQDTIRALGAELDRLAAGT